MTTQQVLNSLGQFSSFDIELFSEHTTRKTLNRNEIILKEGVVCTSVYYVLSGSFFQFKPNEFSETIIDLHLEGEWMFNQQSLVAQIPSCTTIKAFTKSAVLELSIGSFHFLSSKSPSFIQFNKIFNQAHNRTVIFDNMLNPTEKYAFITKAKPYLAQVFPVKMIASFLKIAPETLSRVRAKYSIS